MKDHRPPSSCGVYEPHAAPATAVDPDTYHQAKQAANAAALTPAQRREQRRAARRAAKAATPPPP